MFEQGLIEDGDFCPRCFADILYGEYDENPPYDLQGLAMS